MHLEAVDRFGNMVSATPSGAWISASPIIPSLGFCMNTRAQMFHLDTSHVERLEPGKKPSTTLSPSLVMKEGEPYMTFGTPGGDQQDQWTLQFFLNHVDFGMDIQLALDKPTVHSTHFPGSFWPHAAHPGVMHAEPGIPEEVILGLKKKGHKVIVDEPWSHGRCLAIQYDAQHGRNVRWSLASRNESLRDRMVEHAKTFFVCTVALSRKPAQIVVEKSRKIDTRLIRLRQHGAECEKCDPRI